MQYYIWRKLSAHIKRTITPKNAAPAPNHTHLNREMIEFPDEVRNRTLAIQHRLETAGLRRKIGNNQVRVICINMSGTERTWTLSASKGRKDWTSGVPTI